MPKVLRRSQVTRGIDAVSGIGQAALHHTPQHKIVFYQQYAHVS
jgi:hypothetical protein